jgi:hypothetical protein
MLPRKHGENRRIGYRLGNRRQSATPTRLQWMPLVPWQPDPLDAPASYPTETGVRLDACTGTQSSVVVLGSSPGAAPKRSQSV